MFCDILKVQKVQKPEKWSKLFNAAIAELKSLRFPRFFAPGYSFWRRTRIHRDPGLKIFFRRAVHVQSFQSPCTCTARPVLPSDFTLFDRANQELQNAFLDESLAQKEPKLWSVKMLRFLRISRYFRTDYSLYGHTKNKNREKWPNFPRP